jgi:hypothetical protein
MPSAVDYAAGMPWLSTPLLVSISCWLAWEVGLLVHDLVGRKGRLVQTVARG